MEASTDPDEIVTHGGLFLVGFATVPHLIPPESIKLIIEPPGAPLVSGELEPSYGG